MERVTQTVSTLFLHSFVGGWGEYPEMLAGPLALESCARPWCSLLKLEGMLVRPLLTQLSQMGGWVKEQLPRTDV